MRITAQPYSNSRSPIADQRVSRNFFTPRPSFNKPYTFSLLRLLGLASLFAAVRGQLFPAQLELSSLDGVTGFTINGDQTNDRSGHSVSSAGDVNGDGVADILVGAPGKLDFGKPGKSYVVFGKSKLGADGTLELSSLNSTSGLILNGDQPNDSTGRCVSSAGDVNGDGMTDFLIGAPFAAPAGRGATGKVYVVFGRQSLGSQGALELSSLDGSAGFTLNGVQVGEQTGLSASNAGDVNGDRIADLVIGAFRATPGPGRDWAGKSYVVLGHPTLGAGGKIELGGLGGNDGFTLKGDQTADGSGISVSSAGDVNGDGVSDLLIGTHGASPAGKSYVVFGRQGLGAGGTVEIDLASLNGINGFTINGDKAGDRSGYSVSSAGDVNGDGMADLLIGADGADPAGRMDAGKAYVVFGKVGLGAGGTVELSSLDSTTGFVLNGVAANNRIGLSISSAGDVNGDGVSDLMIGGFYTSKSYVVFGKKGLGAGGTIELSSLNGTNGFTINWSSGSISSVGDVNGDGVSDLVIGDPLAAPGIGREGAGKTYVVFGRRPRTTTHSPTTFLPPDSILERVASLDIFSPSTRPPEFATFSSLSTTSAKIPMGDSVNPSEPPPLGLPLGIAGGVCAVISSIAAAVFAVRRRRQTSPSDPELAPQTSPNEYAAIDSLGLQAPNYVELKLHPKGHTHYTPVNEVLRRHDEYESIKAANASDYAIWPQNQPNSDDAAPTSQGCAELGQASDEYESARLTRAQEHYDDIPHN